MQNVEEFTKQMEHAGLSIGLYQKDNMTFAREFSEAVYFSAFPIISPTEIEFSKGVSGKLPKKTVDADWFLHKIDQKAQRVSINYKNLFKKIEIPGVRFYSATYGFGIECLFQHRQAIKETEKTISDFLNRYGIVHSFEFSDAHWIYRVKISQSADNIAKLTELVKS